MSRIGILIGLCLLVTAFVCLVTLTLDQDSRTILQMWRRQHPVQTGLVQSNLTTNRSEKSVILLWTRFFGETNYLPSPEQKDCAVRDCVVTSNRSMLNQSGAVVFHFLDTSTMDLPANRSRDQMWVLFILESPHNTGSMALLDGLFNWTATYRRDSDLWTPYAHVRRLESRTHLDRDYWNGKSKIAAWFNSNCHTTGGRELFVQELSKHIHVDVFGSCGSLSCQPKMSFDCYRKVAREYYFYLSFENSICRDYVTEKFFHILQFDMVPVVFGGANYSSVAPPNSYVDALSFDSPSSLAQHLNTVSRNRTLYNSYFAWRETHALGGYHWVCELCRRLRYAETTRETASVAYGDLDRWWRTNANCKAWTEKGLKPV